MAHILPVFEVLIGEVHMNFYIFAPLNCNQSMFNHNLSRKMNKLKVLFLIVLFNLTLFSIGQSLNEAGELFNTGIQNAKEENYAGAIDAYKQTINMCDQLGEEGLDLKTKAEQQLTTAYYNNGKSFYKAKKYKEAVAEFKLASDASKKIGDTKTQNASNTYIAGINTSYGNSYLKKEEFEKAIGKYQEAIDLKPDYFKAYYGLGATYKKMGDMEKMKESMDMVLKLAPEGDNTAGKAVSVCATTFKNEGAKALQEGTYEKAINYLNTSLEYDASSGSTYYYLALANNGLANWDAGIAAANKAIELSYAEPSDAYFEIGKANEGKGDTAAACAAYKNVTSGNNVDAAGYQMKEVLKCN
jgi:tetratricopeptide (TPR) repeat protein